MNGEVERTNALILTIIKLRSKFQRMTGIFSLKDPFHRFRKSEGIQPTKYLDPVNHYFWIW